MSGEIAPVPDGQSAFGERYVVDFSAPLPEFTTEGGDAFKASDKERPGKDVYALIHHPTVPMRNEIYRSLKARPVANMVNPVDRGLMTIEQGGRRQRLVTIFERPAGGALFGPDGRVNPRVNTNRLRQSVVLSALKAIAALHKRGFTHRAILPTNMYFVSNDSEEIHLGECYSSPPGYKVPFALESLEVAVAHETARGNGDAACDFYQLGAALQSLYFGEQLWRGRDRDSMLMARVNQGSFWALGGGRDIPGALGTLVRGLMADETEERWAAEDVLDWFEGVGKPKRTSMRAWSMNRPTNFKGVAYVDRRLLADAFARDPREASNFLKSLDFPSWVQLSFRDEILSERLENVLRVTSDSSNLGGVRPDDYKMVTRVCLFIHPTGPVHYKGYSLMLDGLPSMIADAFARDDRDLLGVIHEILDERFLTSLTEICGVKHPKFLAHVRDVRPFIAHSTSKQLGRGMERVLYGMNTILPCISQRFSNVWIGSVKQMMRALDRLAASGGGKNILLDRHVAAFCAAHGTDLEREFNKLAAAQNDPSRFNSLSAEFFGLLQRRFKLESLPNLTEKLVEGLAPAVKSLKNRKRRERVNQLLDKVKKGGDISKLTSEVNMVRIQAEDAREFSQARNALMKLEKDRVLLSRKIQPTDPDARAAGLRGSRWVAFGAMVVVGFLTFFPGG
ncbi:hypothetical protein [Kordiimonas gwangyangensis]|uniref:hypothetical protein n=1 Tax=Kordiimonas gwangyangensis TaxID=288022 RepID=UPI000472B93E|nr:hypothetical protein [Kordiimonas gwangyangensis]